MKEVGYKPRVKELLMYRVVNRKRKKLWVKE